MKRTIIGQQVGSTHLDSQGERLSRDVLKALAEAHPNRVPLHQHHDFTKQVCGSLSNFRVEPDPEAIGHFLLLADVEYDDELVDGNSLGGFSWSLLGLTHQSRGQTEFQIYLPFPLYNDSELIQDLLDADDAISVGRWVKKSADPLVIALFALVAQPLWETIYKETLESSVKRLIGKVRQRWPKNAKLNVTAEAPISTYTPRPKVVLIPPTSRGIDGLDTAVQGIDAAIVACELDYVETGKEIKLIKLECDANGVYRPIGVDYSDGTHRDLRKPRVGDDTGQNEAQT